MMDELRGIYLAKLPERVTTLESDLDAYQRGAVEGLERLRSLAHSLRGSGASYGFPAISDAAAAVEDAAEEDVPARVQALIEVLQAPQSDDSVTLVIISNDPELSTPLRKHLTGPGRQVLVVKSGVQANRMVSDSPPALIVLELVLPDMDGRLLLKKLRITPGLEDVPVIVVATRGNTRMREESFALGADQYFDKACDLSLLAVTVDSALKQLLKAASTTQMRIMSRLLSKRAFADIYERKLRTRKGRSACLLLLELGDLPTKGGDAVLHRVSGALLKHIRAGDQLARYGPSQLVLLASDTHRGGAAVLLRRLAAAVEEEEFQAEGRSFRVTLQGGFAVLHRDPPSLETAVERAQLNLIALQERVGVTAGSREAVGAQTILLAEDDEEFAALVRYVLGQAELSVKHLPSGEGVIAEALKSPVSLFLLDGNLPGLSGFELLKRVRETPLLRDTPVALLTALGHERDVVRGLDLGADDYIVKPCSPMELLARVRKLLRLRKSEENDLGPGGIAGQFHGDHLVELLQMLGSNSKGGRLAVWGDNSNGQIELSDGAVVNAVTSSGRTGAEAAYEILLSPSGRFEYDPTAESDKQPLRMGVGPLLMELMRRRDETGRV